MTATAVTITGTATYPSGAVIPNAIVTFSADVGMKNSATFLTGGQALAGTDGTWSIVVSATTEGGTLPAGGKYDITIKDPVGGEVVVSQRSAVPITTPVVFSTLVAS